MVSSCRTGSPEPFTGYSYDPEGVTETYDREITPQHKRTIGFLSDSVWISNEFPGSRANDVYRVDKYHYRVVIHPEISPVNNSPWYGFRAWSRDSVRVTIELTYPEDGHQRYIPKISRDSGSTWQPLDSTLYQVDTPSSAGILRLDLTDTPVWVSAQEPYTTGHLQTWLDRLSVHPWIQFGTAGYSHEGRPVRFLKISQHSDRPVKGVVLVYNRQHPPEIPGYLTGLTFLETIAGDSEPARQFRDYFDVWAFPLINPDGADNGHWRTNAAGVDLNRDWEYFRQPETAAVRDVLLSLRDRTDRRVFYGIDFHSTGKNVFYPIEKETDTFPLHFTYEWAAQIRKQMPELNLAIEPFDIRSPIAKNWTFKTFGADAVTFEVWDEIPREQIERLGVLSAETFMKGMIEAYHNEFSNPEPVQRK